MHTNFEVSMFEDMRGNAKLKWFGVMGGSRSLAMSPIDRAHETSYLTLVETCTVFELSLASYLSKIAYFDLPTCIWRPRLGWSRSNFAETCGTRK